MNVVTKADISIALRELRAEYRFLQHQPAADLNSDERRGVEHYLADTGAVTANVTHRGWVTFIHQLDELVTRHGRMSRPAGRQEQPTRETRLHQHLNNQRAPNV